MNHTVCARPCSFDPEQHRFTAVYANGESESLLSDAAKVIWFGVYCAEHNVRGLIDDSEVTFDAAANVVTATACVYLDGVLAGKSTAFRVMDPEDEFLSSVCTRARGRALANAGFDVLPLRLSDGQEETSALPRQEPKSDVLDRVTGLVPDQVPGRTAMPLDEAMEMCIPIGTMKGKTFREAMEADASIIRFYAEDFRNPRYPEVQQAARIIRQEME